MSNALVRSKRLGICQPHASSGQKAGVVLTSSGTTVLEAGASARSGSLPLYHVVRGPERNLQQTRVDLVEVDVGEVIEEAAERHGTDASIGAW
jgi:hypothetical protein